MENTEHPTRKHCILIVKEERKLFETQLKCHLPCEVCPHGDIRAHSMSFSHWLRTSLLSTYYVPANTLELPPCIRGAPARRGVGHTRLLPQIAMALVGHRWSQEAGSGSGGRELLPRWDLWAES